MRNQGGVINVPKGDGTPGPILVAGTAVAYSRTMPLNMGNYFGIWFQATSVIGTADVKVEFEQGPVDLTDAQQDAAHSSFIVADGATEIDAQANDEKAHLWNVSPVPMTYCRFKITGLGSNPADTLIQMYFFIQEQA